jgi:hypothetical protein
LLVEKGVVCPYAVKLPELKKSGRDVTKSYSTSVPMDLKHKHSAEWKPYFQKETHEKLAVVLGADQKAARSPTPAKRQATLSQLGVRDLKGNRATPAEQRVATVQWVIYSECSPPLNVGEDRRFKKMIASHDPAAHSFDHRQMATWLKKNGGGHAAEL